VWLPVILLAGGFFRGAGGRHQFEGGWHWQSLAVALAEGVLATCVSLWAIDYFRRRRNHLRPLARRMAAAAYGAFIIHPPLLVGLAFAVQPLALPAELKFITLLTAAVSAAFGLAALANRTRSLARIVGSSARAEAGLPFERPSARPGPYLP
jgi:glucans biosynthesis protein C